MIAAEGEQKASRALREAAETIADSHSALQVSHSVTKKLIQYINMYFLNDDY